MFLCRKQENQDGRPVIVISCSQSYASIWELMQIFRLSMEGHKEECLHLKESVGVSNSSFEPCMATIRDTMKMVHYSVCSICIVKYS